ncbi:sigma-E processing peptidase SpoIIGA [Jeotgalibacillus terrae]|uniref:Sigma-E processing peptidase SpoIIGA n=1 Tax=Jeotgalibacillus terrae TaxID=587735 RepID=A0ABW5ZGB6_9BACL|nr:sigma-E processing peptidase SpoIIGA [Jeotgalibacillus terrae]MBM7578417.1 stage II sporulation protein GA (sporulation sigma-E factor processing peptidase) [Jeotgalibacillus terrae]
MTLYIEYLLIVNIGGGLILLLTLNRLLKTQLKVGAACMVLLIYTGLEWYFSLNGSEIIKIIAPMLMIAAVKVSIRKQVVLHAVSLCLFLFSSGSMASFVNGLLSESTPVTGLALLFLILSIHLLLAGRISWQVSSSSVQQSYIYEVELTLGKKMWAGNGYLDSGNALITPFSGKPVMFADFSVAKYLLPDEVLCFIKNDSDCPEEWKQKIHYIPTKSVHKECDVLISIECDRIKVCTEDDHFVFEKIPVIFSLESHYVDRSCHCLLNPLQMLHCYQI